LWDAVTGEMRDARGRFDGDSTEVTLYLPANGSTFVVFRRAVSRPAGSAPANARGAMALDGEWTVSFDGAPIALPSLTSWTAHPDQAVKYFSGTATYRKRFTVPAGWIGGGRTRLDLGRLWAIGEVKLNGKPLGIVWTPPYAVDCTAALREGSNELTVEITNTWFNRLVGDARLPEERRVTRTNTPASGGRPWSALEPVESGLFGPVRLERR
jgi:hypothetical protein